jgi:hypothetical protein
MAQFNKTVRRQKTVVAQMPNKEGAMAFKPSDQLEFILRASTTVAKMDTFYEDGAESNRRFVELARLFGQYDPEFAMQTAWYTRNKFNMRTPTTVILAEAAYAGARGFDNVSDYVAKSIKRVDDMTELLAYCLTLNKKMRKTRANLPQVLRKGLAKAFVTFDSYQFAKYTKDDMAVKPRDVMFLAHPKPREGQRNMFENIIGGTLPLPETWENYIMVNGSTKKNWTYILDKMGYMGIVRNLRNLMKHGVNIDDVCTEVRDPERVRKSRMLPVQFYTAYRQIEKTDYAGVGAVKAALSDAMTLSAMNLDKIPGNTAVFCDNSGSMKGTIHPKSTVEYNDVGNVFGAMIASRADNCIVCGYGSEVVNAKLNARDSILTNVDKIDAAGSRAGGATYPSKCIDFLDKNMPNVDRIVFLTDEQGYGQSSCYDALNRFRQNHGVNPYVYTFDIQHYGTTQFPETERKHCTVGGWSDNTLRFINLYERDGTSLVDEVRSIDITMVR